MYKRQVLSAAKAGDSDALNQAVTAEYANATAIGDFLADANPTNWPKADMEAMMATHIDQTLVYATDMLQGDYSQAIANYGLAEAHMVEMADMLSGDIRRWSEVPREEKRSLFEQFATHLTITKYSRHHKRLVIHWRDGSTSERVSVAAPRPEATNAVRPSAARGSPAAEVSWARRSSAAM